MTFIIYKDRASEWRWRLVAVNGRIVADSGEGYATKSNAKRGVRRFKLAMLMANSLTSASEP